jgi:hypothetical protein
MAILIVEKLRGENKGKSCAEGNMCVSRQSDDERYKRKYVHVMYSLQLYSSLFMINNGSAMRCRLL